MEPVTVTADADVFTCNAYLVPGETPALVDAGAMPGVEDVIAEHADRLDRVVVTHQDGDHVAQLDAVLDAFDADLYAYGDHPRKTHDLADGDTVALGDDAFEVVYTPGHADDHVAFASETALFSGDVVVYNDGAFDDGSFGKTEGPHRDREVLIDSLRELLDRLPDSVTAMYAGHGDPFHAEPGGDSVREVIERALARAERREPKYPE